MPDLELARFVERLQREPRTPPPFDGVDRTGMPPLADLAVLEDNALRRLSPRRNRWPDLVELDARASELEQRQTAVSTQLADLHEQLAAAPARDADALAEWHLHGAEGDRPEPRAEALQQAISEEQENYDALTLATGKVLAEKAAFVERHRKRLVQDADRHAEEALARVHDLIDQLAEARQELAEVRQAAVWASTFPAAEASQEAPHALLAGGLRRPVESTLGTPSQVAISAVWRVLHSDADWLRNACTIAQHQIIQGRDPKAAGAVWAKSPEGQAEAIREQLALMERSRMEGTFGHVAEMERQELLDRLAALEMRR